MRSSWVLLAVTQLATAAQAQEDAARDALNRGRLLYEQGVYETAREQFLEAKRLAPDAPNPHRWLGLTDLKLGRCPEALWELEQFLQLVKPDDKRIPEVTAARDQCKEAVKPRGILVVESSPPGAEVRLDDPGSAALGLTPYRNEGVAVGTHAVHVALAGHVPDARSVVVNKGEETKIRIDLRLQPPAPVAAAEASAPSKAGASVTEAPPHPKKRTWIAGVVVGVVAAGALAIGLGVGLSSGVSYPSRATHDGTFQF